MQYFCGGLGPPRLFRSCGLKDACVNISSKPAWSHRGAKCVPRGVFPVRRPVCARPRGTLTLSSDCLERERVKPFTGPEWGCHRAGGPWRGARTSAPGQTLFRQRVSASPHRAGTTERRQKRSFVAAAFQGRTRPIRLLAPASPPASSSQACSAGTSAKNHRAPAFSRSQRLP